LSTSGYFLDENVETLQNGQNGRSNTNDKESSFATRVLNVYHKFKLNSEGKY
jgi:hypothetical protein